MCLYRIAQEALRNIAKHSRAREAWVALTATDDGILLSIEDTGVGFSSDQTRGKLGLGLDSMEERARLIGGEFTIRSEPGKGTFGRSLGPMFRGDAMKKARVLVADDHRILAEGLRSLLEPEFELVDIVEDGRALVARARELSPDVIVADITMPLLNGIEAIRQLKKADVPAKVVFLTMHQDVTYAAKAFELGASGFVLKHSAPSELVTAIREALAGRTYVTPLIAGELMQAYRERAPTGKTRRST